MNIRAFCALALNRETRTALASFQAQMSDVASVRWVDDRALHLTLRFLGDIDRAQVTALKAVLNDVVPELPPFQLTVRGVDAFPSLHRPRVIWAGITDGTDDLGLLASLVESAVQAVGLPPEERPFHPHVTLARVKAGSQEVARALAHRTEEWEQHVFGVLQISELFVFQSLLQPHGAEYTPLWRLPLGSETA